MSKLDYVTIAIVAVCVAALIYLVYSVIGLMGDPKPKPTEQVAEQPADDFYTEDDTLAFDDEGEVIRDEAAQPGADSDGYQNDPSPTYADEDLSESDAGAQTNYQEEEVPASQPGEVNRPTGYREGNYLVIAGSYRYQYNAEAEAERLQKLGYGQAEATLFNRGAYATVLVNRFDNLSDARALARELKDRHGVEAYVQKKREM